MQESLNTLKAEELLGLTRKLAEMDVDTTITQLQCLLEIYLNPSEMRVSDIAKRSLVTPPSTTRTVDLYSEIGFNKKEGKGFIRRDADPKDRRFKLLTLTPKGKQFVESLFRKAS